MFHRVLNTPLAVQNVLLLVNIFFSINVLKGSYYYNTFDDSFAKHVGVAMIDRDLAGFLWKFENKLLLTVTLNMVFWSISWLLNIYIGF